MASASQGVRIKVRKHKDGKKRKIATHKSSGSIKISEDKHGTIIIEKYNHKGKLTSKTVETLAQRKQKLNK